MIRLKSEEYSEQGLPENSKNNQYFHIFLLIFSLNKFLKIILGKLIMLNLWGNIAPKTFNTGLPDF